MADVMMELNGVRKRVPADKVARFQGKGAKIVQDTTAAPTPEPAPAAPEAPPAEPTMWERAREGVKGAGRAVADVVRGEYERGGDMGQSFLKGASLGLDDEIAALTARAGGLVQRQRDSDDMVGAGGGESVLESWRATEPLGEEAKQERRAETARASQRSPISSGVGTLAGAITAGMAAPGAQGGRLAQVASGAATGAVGGAGMGDAEGEDAAVDALMGGALGGGLTAGVQGAGAIRNVLRARSAAPKVAAAAKPVLVPTRQQAADVAQAVANEGPYGAARKFLIGKAAEKIRGAPTPTPPARPEWMAGLTDDVGAVADDASGLELGRVLRPKQKPLPEFDVDVVDDLDPIAVQADDIVEEVATASPPLQPDDVMVTPQRAPAPTPPAPAPAGPVVTDLRRSTLGRRATQTEIRNAVEAVATRDGNASIEHLTNQIGAPTGEIQAVLAPMMRDFKFREAVKAGVRPAGGASSAIAEADEMGRTIRDAQQGARSPIDNVSGRKADQVFAVQQQERWRSAYDALPAEQRAAFVQQLRATSGLSDDAVRQRLKMTKAEWRRTSFERSKAAAPMAEMPQRRPVLRPKAEEPTTSGGEGEGETLTDIEQALADENARETAAAIIPGLAKKEMAGVKKYSDALDRAIASGDVRMIANARAQSNEAMASARAGMKYDEEGGLFRKDADYAATMKERARRARNTFSPSKPPKPEPVAAAQPPELLDELADQRSRLDSAIKKAESNAVPDLEDARSEAFMTSFNAGNVGDSATIAEMDALMASIDKRIAEARRAARPVIVPPTRRPVLRKKSAP